MVEPTMSLHRGKADLTAARADSEKDISLHNFKGGGRDERTPQGLERGGNAEGTAKTGQGAWRITRSVVLPRSASRAPW